MATFTNRYQFNALFHNVIVYSGALDLANAATGSGTFASTDVTVVGARLGDFVLVSLAIDTIDTAVIAAVTANDIVTVTVLNNTAGAVNLASATVRIAVLQPSVQNFYI